MRQVIARQEDHTHRQIARIRHAQTLQRQIAANHLARQLRQDARAVAALAVRGDRAAVRVIGQRGQCRSEDLVAAPAVLLRHKPHAARVVLVLRLI